MSSSPKPCVSTSLDQWLEQAESICQQRGSRLTAQRKTVLSLILCAEKPMTAYEILEQLPSTGRKPAPPTVYRALDFLLDEGLIHKLESIHAYVGCSHPDHQHNGQFLICNSCGDVNEIENKALEKSLKSVEQAAGFETRHPVVELLGTCSDCKSK